jgi:predicted nucleic acid-binding protein
MHFRPAMKCIDANVVVYGVSNKSAQCRQFLMNAAARTVSGFATVEVIAEACHKLMLAEATAKRLISRMNASLLQGKTVLIQALNDYWTTLTSKAMSGVAILPLDEFRFQRAHRLRVAHGLMTNDSLLLAAADLFGIPSIATADSDFDHVPWLNVYKPTDLP